jgi:hypothetical protein
VDLGRCGRGGRHHVAFGPGEDQQDHVTQPVARPPAAEGTPPGPSGAPRPNDPVFRGERLPVGPAPAASRFRPSPRIPSAPGAGNPSSQSWRDFIDHLLELAEDAYDLLVIDTVRTFLPGAPNNPRALYEAFHELRVVGNASAGMSLLHQTGAARGGSGAGGPLRSFADILIDMQVPPGDRRTRRRSFERVGRYPGTLRQVPAESNVEGTGYLQVADEPPPPLHPPALETLRQLLQESPTPLTRQEVLARWPEGLPTPRADSLWRSLARGCEVGILVRTGEGTKAEAFRYDLAERKPRA